MVAQRDFRGTVCKYDRIYCNSLRYTEVLSTALGFAS